MTPTLARASGLDMTAFGALTIITLNGKLVAVATEHDDAGGFTVDVVGPAARARDVEMRERRNATLIAYRARKRARKIAP